MNRVFPQRIGNRINPWICLTGVLFLAMTLPLTAELSAGFNVGTLGAGIDLTAKPTASIGLRAGVNYGQWKQTVIMDDAEVERALQEEVESLEDDLRGFRFYPVIAIGVSRRF